MRRSPAIASHWTADGTEAQAALHTLADGLTSQGFDIAGQAWEQSHQLAITNVRGALCQVSLRDDGHLTWEYRLCHGTYADPAHLTGIVLRLLGADIRQPAPRYPGLTLKGVVGRALAACGMTVRLVILQHDDITYDLYAEVEATNPTRLGRGRVRITDHATLRWECPHPATSCAAALNPADLAAIIARALDGQST